jgi:UDP-N-acetylmuramyl pentapeptide phosphotransferase/UDP-N-acetylglucosamine-1-phosphate transferase
MLYLSSATLILFAIIWHVVVFRLGPKYGLVRPNFRGQPVLASYGLVSFVYISALIGVLSIVGYIDWLPARMYLGVMGLMWTLGVLDDIYGTREFGGFKGHFTQLFVKRKLTTGAVKALGGGAVALYAGWRVADGNIIMCLVDALLIALSTNILNLLDLRPGRAVAVFFVGIGVTCIVAGGQIDRPWVVGVIAAVTLAFGIVDSRGKAMMGDAGSNSLGAALGLTIALNTKDNISFQLVCIALMAALHVYSEMHSVNALIERNRVLRGIDSLVGVRRIG